MKKTLTVNRIQLQPRRIYRILFSTMSLLIIINIFLHILYYQLKINFPGFGTLRFLFNVDIEKNIPTLFSYLILLLATSLLAIISNIKKIQGDQQAGLWWLMTGIFFYLATDEILESHEYLAIVLRKAFNLSGIFWYAWIIPFSVAILLLCILFYRFVFFYLPAPVRKMFITSGVIYISGALGMEMIGAWFFTHYGNDHLNWVILTSIEECLEMFGIIYFIQTLLLYSQQYLGSVIITSQDGPVLK
jgi:hypothetical protein